MLLMPSCEVIEIYDLLLQNNILIWLDGGWGVDALLEVQTRPHKDLDIVIQQKDLAAFRELVARRGYNDVYSDDHRAWNFVLGNNRGQQIDVHVILFDEHGNGIYGPVENNQCYPASSLTATGIIDGHTLSCLTPEYMISSHTGYVLQDKDYHDIHALCQRFNIEYPEECNLKPRIL